MIQNSKIFMQTNFYILIFSSYDYFFIFKIVYFIFDDKDWGFFRNWWRKWLNFKGSTIKRNK